jgi:hypothetical protein
MERDARLEAGRQLARRYFGEGVVERWREISPDLEETTSRFAFGDIWTRPALRCARAPADRDRLHRRPARPTPNSGGTCVGRCAPG